MKVGDKAPQFSLETGTGTGETVKLKDLLGKPVILYFYPKDDTSGCSKEACDFRDTLPAIRKAGAIVLGISPDTTTSHAKFAKKYDLTFPLLADPDHAVAEKYGVWVEKSMYGRKYMGIERTTFLIDAKGKIAEVWSKVKVPGHVEKVVETLKSTK
jgi:thioredoxin-dependent peroxiredoxin